MLYTAHTFVFKEKLKAIVELIHGRSVMSYEDENALLVCFVFCLLKY